MGKKVFPVGIIAEDDSDVDSFKILIRRISGNGQIGIKKFVGRGCGKIKRKCNAWAKQLRDRGCGTLIIIHDLDNNVLDELRRKITIALDPCPVKKHMICIPVREFEAWLLSDVESIKLGLNLRNAPKEVRFPERIESAKEYLEKIVDKASNGEKLYLNTKHNAKLSEIITIDNIISHCPSFVPFYEFVRENY